MHEQFPSNVEFRLHLQFYQTGLGELEDTLHGYFLWLVYQRTQVHTPNFIFESSKGFHALEFTCDKSKFCTRRF